MAKKKAAANDNVINLTVHEAAQMLKTISSLLDMVVIVDPKEGMIWEIDENEDFHPVSPCYCVWNKDKRCENCAPLQSLKSGSISSKFEKKAMRSTTFSAAQ